MPTRAALYLAVLRHLRAHPGATDAGLCEAVPGLHPVFDLDVIKAARQSFAADHPIGGAAAGPGTAGAGG